jgi:hypothetical protein
VQCTVQCQYSVVHCGVQCQCPVQCESAVGGAL